MAATAQPPERRDSDAAPATSMPRSLPPRQILNQDVPARVERLIGLVSGHPATSELRCVRG